LSEKILAGIKQTTTYREYCGIRCTPKKSRRIMNQYQLRQRSNQLLLLSMTPRWHLPPPCRETVAPSARFEEQFSGRGTPNWTFGLRQRMAAPELLTGIERVQQDPSLINGLGRIGTMPSADAKSFVFFFKLLRHSRRDSHKSSVHDFQL
jgi:hypothetical protein